MLFRKDYENPVMAIPTRTAAILFVVIGIFSLVALSLYYVAFTSKVYASAGTESPSKVAYMFSPSNIDCALHSGSCDILHDNP